MNIAAEVFDSSQNRPVGLRKRLDLSAVRQVYRHELFWLIKDPLEMEFYRLNDEEYAVLELLDGKNSIDNIKEKFEQRFSPQRITHRQLQTFVSDLNKKSLLAFTGSDVGPQLIEREREKRNEKLMQGLASILSVKWRGVDPDRFLDWLTPKVGWVFSAPAVTLGVAFMLSAMLWLAIHADAFVARLPGLGDFFGQGNWLLLGVVIIVMKIIHEFAHGVTFKRFGGECHEIGIMLLMIVMPTLYCSTSDSWMLKSKWQRAAIGAAGMYVELLIAAAATFLWWFSEPGTLNMICLNIMATGTVSVVLMNGNPFFKFDGYYIFSDVMELPNLVERSGKQTQSLFLKVGLGIDEPAEPNSSPSTRLMLVSYSVMAFAFKLALMALIQLMLIERLSRYGLGYVGLTIGLIGVVGLFAPGMFNLYKFFKVPGRLHRIEMKNSILLTGGAVLSFVLFFCVPFPHYVHCSFTIEPKGGQAIYVRHQARLHRIYVKPGEQVKAGQLLAELQNLDKSLELERLKATRDQYASELELLEQSRESSGRDASRIAELSEKLKTNELKILEFNEIVASYHITSPRDGQVIPEWVGVEPERGMELGSFDRTPLSDENLGSDLPRGQKLCTIGDLTKFDAVLAINEHDVSYVQPHQQVALMLDSMSQSRINQSIESIAEKETDHLPQSLSRSHGGTIQAQATQGTGASKDKPNDQHYEARVPLPQLESGICSGLRGQARVRVGTKTAFQRLAMLFYSSFRKKLS